MSYSIIQVLVFIVIIIFMLYLNYYILTIIINFLNRIFLLLTKGKSCYKNKTYSDYNKKSHSVKEGNELYSYPPKPFELFAYEARESIFTENEKNLYTELLKEHILTNDFHIFPKVNMYDVFKVKESIREQKSAFQNIALKHFDFIIATKNSFKPVLIIELDDNFHDNDVVTKKNDRVKNNISTHSDIPLLRVRCEMIDGIFYYEKAVDEIKKTITVFCPKCGKKLQLPSMSFQNGTRKFWHNRNDYNECRYMKSIPEGMSDIEIISILDSLR